MNTIQCYSVGRVKIVVWHRGANFKFELTSVSCPLIVAMSKVKRIAREDAFLTIFGEVRNYNFS